MTARASSIYSLRVLHPTEPAPQLLNDLVAGLRDLEVPRLDSHVRTEDGQPYAAVGFRAADDTEARRIAEGVLGYVRPGFDYRLITGYGVNRREVVSCDA
jgi:hypothetical protein